jgi:lysozyme
MLNRELLKDELKRDEGLRLKPYRCTAGKLSIGVGRNLDDVGISETEALVLLDHDIEKVIAQLNYHLAWWHKLSEPRQRVLINMTFNMGIGTVLTFKKTLALIETGKYPESAKAMLQSRWAKQVGERANRLAKIMELG